MRLAQGGGASSPGKMQGYQVSQIHRAKQLLEAWQSVRFRENLSSLDTVTSRENFHTQERVHAARTAMPT